ncbi:hypothetical protein Pint_12838 [Pistacia integerrima]|uniref:Uncharacterized protein n=1 Tax=Pistacia integerrima TaxID=434235 RepID=A0ACC0Y5G3_9ROSI|nr:hypothetical protein Pint_12838 [Pistacia integerrima]
MVNNVTRPNGLISSGTSPVHEFANNTMTTKVEDIDPSKDLVSENNDGGEDPDEESETEKLDWLNKNSTVQIVQNADNGPAPVETRNSEQSITQKNDTVGGDFSEFINERENNTLTSRNKGRSGGGAHSPFPVSPPIEFLPNKTLPETNVGTPVVPVYSNISSKDKDTTTTFRKNEKSGKLQSDFTTFGKNNSVTVVPEEKKEPEIPNSAVISIAEMNDLLLKSRASYHSMRPRWSSAVDRELLHARVQIENAPIFKNDNELYSPLYRNVSMFKSIDKGGVRFLVANNTLYKHRLCFLGFEFENEKSAQYKSKMRSNELIEEIQSICRSYELMEQKVKVYVYKEGQKPIFHQPVLKGIYASEGWFMKLLQANKKIVTKDPRKAQLFYLPFSSRMLEETLYVQNSHSHKNLIQHLKNYLDFIAAKHSFWNRTDGADHFLVSCHDWAPSETKRDMAKCIRALCNADVKEGFVFGKDVSLPETYVRSPQNPLRQVGGKPPSKRSILAFFAGGMHGYLRPILLQHWGDKDPDMKIFGVLPKVKGNMNYVHYMKSSKYCICAKGYEVNSPRVVEAIFYECVPVIISDNFVPPFFEILNWDSFAVFVLEKDIPNLKNILLSIPEKRYREMQMRVKKVQQHFLWHPKPVKYDIFNMILHSVWYNRVFLARPR